MSAGHFRQDAPGGFGAVDRSQDGAAHDDVAGAVFHGLDRRQDAFLVSGLGTGRSDTRCDDEKFGAELLPQDRQLPRRGDHAIHAGTLGESGTGEDFIRHIAGHTGEDGDGYDPGSGVYGGRGAQHFFAAGAVDGQHEDMVRRGCGHGVGDGMGDVVELQVEEDLPAFTVEKPDDVRADPSEELAANFVDFDVVAQLADDGRGFGKGVHVERHDKL